MPNPEQEAIMLRHSAHARYVWNLAVEQQSHWRSGRQSAPGYLEQCRQLTAARMEYAWLREGLQMVQQQALRDFAQAMVNFFAGTHRRPTWRKAGRKEGFRIVAVKPGDVRRLNRNWGQVRVPKVGWVRFRWSRAVPDGAKSFRITRDGVGHWHVAFAVIPEPVPAPGTGQTVGIDRGVAVSAALSTGELLHVPDLSEQEQKRLKRLERRLSRAKRGSNRRGQTRLAVAKLKGCEADRRKDWCEKVSTDIARRFDVIRVENLKVENMTRSARGTVRAPGRNVQAKAALNQGIRRSGWGLLVRRLEEKASGRVERVPPAFTSQRCSACGHVAAESRENQALFRCAACGFMLNADVNAAKNIAAGHAVSARGGLGVARPVNREPQLLPLSA
jgi:transposase